MPMVGDLYEYLTANLSSGGKLGANSLPVESFFLPVEATKVSFRIGSGGSF